MKSVRFILPLTLALVTAGGLRTAAAQSGPPPHIVRAVDALAALARSSDDDAVDRFIDDAMDPSAIEDRVETAAHVADIRDAVSGLTDDISVEDDGSGPVMIFIGESGEMHVQIDATPDGVRGLTLVEPSPDQVSGREGVVRDHIRALERLASADISEALAAFEEERFTASFLERTTQSQRRNLLQSIGEAAGNATSIGVDFDGSRYLLRFGGIVSSVVVIVVQPNAPWKIARLELQSGGNNPE